MNRGRHTAFTLVELLVVVGIIGILVAVLLPALSTVRRNANKLQTQAKFTAISTGLETFRNDLDTTFYPPSSGESLDPSERWTVASPFADASSFGGGNIYVAGANLMVWALAGADLIGTPGFRDLGDDEGWQDNSGGLQNGDGLYSLSDEGDALQKRYGPYVDLSKGDIVTVGEFAIDALEPRSGTLAAQLPLPNGDPFDYENQVLMKDGFGFPILYYRAAKAKQIVSSQDGNDIRVGIYSQGDNALYTAGSDNFLGQQNGLDLGAGSRHYLNELPSGSDPSDSNLDLDQEIDSFAKFVWDPRIRVRNTPVNPDSYILVSPGPDALWGTEDDITNFEK